MLWILRTLLMLRNVLTVFVLAALTVTSANGSTVPPAKTHRNVQPKATLHKKTQHAAAPVFGPSTAHARIRAGGRGTRRESGIEALRKYPDAGRSRTTLAQERRRPNQARAVRIPARNAEPSAPKRDTPFRKTGHSAGLTRVSSRWSGHSAPQAEIATNREELPVREASVPAAAEVSANDDPVARGSAEDSVSGAEVPASAETTQASPATLPVKRAIGAPARAVRPAVQDDAPAADADAPAKDAEGASGETEIASIETRAPGRLTESRPFSLRSGRGVMPPPLVGSRASLERQNTKSDGEGLERIEDEEDLADRIAHKLLVPVPASRALVVNGNLPENHRYCRPWTARFLADLARQHAAQFHRPLEVSSAVRTVAYQKRLMEINGNAAAAEGDIVSPHLTGATIDIAKGPLSREEIAWMRTQLLPLEQAGKIDVEEEFLQACFHITVYKNYVPAAAARRAAPQRDRAGKPGSHRRVQPRTDPQTADAPPEIASRGR
jgi:hypothetical protein